MIAEAGVIFKANPNFGYDHEYDSSRIWLSPEKKYMLVNTFSNEGEQWFEEEETFGTMYFYHLYLIDIKAGTAVRLTEIEGNSVYYFIDDDTLSVWRFYKVEEYGHYADIYKVDLPAGKPDLVAEGQRCFPWTNADNPYPVSLGKW